MNYKSILTSGCMLFFAAGSLHAQTLTVLSNFSANQPGGTSAGEIVAFDPSTDRLFVTSSGSGVHRVNIFNAAVPSAPTTIGTVDFSTAFGVAADMSALTSVAVDPLGRFGAATLVPTSNTTVLGKIGFFNLSTGALIGTADVGYHPDSLVFSADGSKLVVVNEGEFNAASAVNAPGSLSVFDVSGINSGNLATLPTLAATTKDFSTGNLASGVTITGLRNSNIAAVGTNGTFISAVPDFNNLANVDYRAIEPEYATIVGDKVYVSLQDNNAVAEYDLNANQWTKITSLGKIATTIDASDQDGGINIAYTVSGLPMPDTVASFVVSGKTYVVTANEGDARGDDRDISRFGTTSGNGNMNSILYTNSPGGFPTTATGIRATNTMGRLNISRIDGDTNGDGKIDDPTMLGTRSFSIWEVTAGGLTLAYNSTNFFETYIRDNAPGDWVDSRSDDKGPEPEGLTLGVINGRTYAYIAMERNSGIFVFDVTDPNNPTFIQYTRVSSGGDTPLRPEGMQFVSAADSPNGIPMLIVGYEGDGTAVLSERVVIFQAIPEPSSFLLTGLGLALVALRRRRANAL
jgi:hypothetical protein